MEELTLNLLFQKSYSILRNVPKDNMLDVLLVRCSQGDQVSLRKIRPELTH
jgi:hypothetical protein